MNPIEDRLRGSARMGAHNGNSSERSICGKQMLEAAAEIERLREETRIARRNAIDRGKLVADLLTRVEKVIEYVERTWPEGALCGSKGRRELLARLRGEES